MERCRGLTMTNQQCFFSQLSAENRSYLLQRPPRKKHLRNRLRIAARPVQVPGDGPAVELREHLHEVVNLRGVESRSAVGGRRGLPGGRGLKEPSHDEDRDGDEDDDLRYVQRLLCHGRDVRETKWRRWTATWGWDCSTAEAGCLVPRYNILAVCMASTGPRRGAGMFGEGEGDGDGEGESMMLWCCTRHQVVISDEPRLAGLTIAEPSASGSARPLFPRHDPHVPPPSTSLLRVAPHRNCPPTDGLPEASAPYAMFLF